MKMFMLGLIWQVYLTRSPFRIPLLALDPRSNKFQSQIPNPARIAYRKSDVRVESHDRPITNLYHDRFSKQCMFASVGHFIAA